MSSPVDGFAVSVFDSFEGIRRRHPVSDQYDAKQRRVWRFSAPEWTVAVVTEFDVEDRLHDAREARCEQLAAATRTSVP